MVNESVINKIKEYLIELTEKGLDIHKAILYGSYTKGAANEDSDIDLLLVSKQFDNDIDKFTDIVWLSQIRSEYRIEPYMVGEQRFYTGFSPLIDAAKYEGVEIRIN